MAAHPAPLWAGWTALAAFGVLGYHLADRRRPAWWILLAVQAAQASLHVWFTCCTPADPGSAPPPIRMATHGPNTPAIVHGGAVMSHGAGMSLGMVGVHLLAGSVAAAWLYAGERALWRTLRVLAGFLVDRTLPVLVLLAWIGLPIGFRAVRVAFGRAESAVAPAVVVLRHVLVRRGPPRFSGLRQFT